MLVMAAMLWLFVQVACAYHASKTAHVSCGGGGGGGREEGGVGGSCGPDNPGALDAHATRPLNIKTRICAAITYPYRAKWQMQLQANCTTLAAASACT